jgi:hypothetical protein
MKFLQIQPAFQPRHGALPVPAEALTPPSDFRPDADRHLRIAFRILRALLSNSAPIRVNSCEFVVIGNPDHGTIYAINKFERSSNAARRLARGAINAPRAALKYESLIRRFQRSHPLPAPPASALAPPPSSSTQHPVTQLTHLTLLIIPYLPGQKPDC